jgi:hypothetical protein
MIRQTDNLTQQSTVEEKQSPGIVAPSMAIFTLPKPFVHPHINTIQRNAIASWKALGPQVETILMGSDSGIKETAKEFNTRYASDIRCNEHGTPLLDDAFRLASEMTKAEVLVYCNCDVILFRDLLQTVQLIQSDERMKSFVAFGRRTNLRIEHEIDFDHPHTIEELLTQAKSHGTKAPVVCKEYFAFTRDLFRDIPEFAVGRGNWDNWMIAHAKSTGVPAVDVSPMVTIVHQDHDYQHLKNTRLNCYVSGDEARKNQKLAGGKNVIGGSTGSWKFRPQGLQKVRAGWLNQSFWLDFHRFAKMVARLPFQR